LVAIPFSPLIKSLRAFSHNKHPSRDVARLSLKIFGRAGANSASDIYKKIPGPRGPITEKVTSRMTSEEQSLIINSLLLTPRLSQKAASRLSAAER
jgi:hypothetical protein